MNPLISLLFYQTLATIIIGFFLMVASRIWGKKGNEWNIAALGTFFFIVVNNIIGLFREAWWKYTGFSLISIFIALLFLMLLARIISSQTLSEFGNRAMVFLAPVLYYPVIVLVAGIIKLIAAIVE